MTKKKKQGRTGGRTRGHRQAQRGRGGRATSRRPHSPEVRLRPVRQVVDGGKSVVDVADAFGIPASTLYPWVRRYRERGAPAGALRTERPVLSDDRTQLRDEVTELAARTERDHELDHSIAQRGSDLLR